MSHDIELAAGPALSQGPRVDSALSGGAEIGTLVVLTSGLCWTPKYGKM